MSHQYDYCKKAAAEYERLKANAPEVFYSFEQAANEEIELNQKGLLSRADMLIFNTIAYWKSTQCTADRMKLAAMAKMEENMDEEDFKALEEMRDAMRSERRTSLISTVSQLARMEVKQAALKSTNRATFLQNLRTQGKETAELVKEAGCDEGLMNKLFLAECVLRGW